MRVIDYDRQVNVLALITFCHPMMDITGIASRVQQLGVDLAAPVGVQLVTNLRGHLSSPV
jgi:hypothetical protein